MYLLLYIWCVVLCASCISGVCLTLCKLLCAWCTMPNVSVCGAFVVVLVCVWGESGVCVERFLSWLCVWCMVGVCLVCVLMCVHSVLAVYMVCVLCVLCVFGCL